ncbi:MAG: AsmA family protein [Gammaproteobacteria bacterium]|nr:AsmA family protein [Gammaproteobacteria bacterium]
MKFLKISLYSLAAIVLLLAIAATIFVATFDANEYKPLISDQVKMQTGRDITLDDIKPSVFPWLGLQLQQVSLSNAQGFKADKMLQVENIDVRIELIPLLMQEIRVDTLRIHGLTLNLEKDKTGKMNWHDILEKQAPPIEETAQTKTPQKDVEDVTEQPRSDPLAALLINGLEIKDANINWLDQSSGQNVSLQKFNLTTGSIRPAELVPVTMSAMLKLTEPAVDLKIEMDSSLQFDLQANKLNLKKLDLLLDADLQEQDLKQVSLRLKTQLTANLDKQHFLVPAYTLDINAKGDSLPGAEIKASIEGDADVDLQKQVATIKQIKFSSSGVILQSQLAVSQLLDAPNIKGQFQLENFNPKDLLKKLAIELPETKSNDVLNNANLSFGLVASEKALEIKLLKLKLDKTTLLADVKVVNLEKPIINYSVNVDQINLDSYLPPPAKALPAANQASLPASPAGAPVDIPVDLPVEVLRSLNVTGLINVKSLQAFDQSVSDLEVKMLASQGLIKIPTLNASLLKGRVASSAQLDVRKNTPRYQFKLKGSGLEADSIVNPVLQDILGEKSVSMSGVTNLNADITSKGQTVNQLIAASNGRFNLNMGEAKLHGVDAEYFVRKGVVDFLAKKKQDVPAGWRGEYNPEEKTALKVAKASAIITNGVIDNRDLLLDSSRFKITGAGKINLPKENLDYRIVVDVKSTKTQSASDRLLDLPMPVIVKGGFAQPKISIDSKVWLKSANKEIKAAAKKEVKKKIEEEKKEIKEKVKDKLKDKFKGFF